MDFKFKTLFALILFLGLTVSSYGQGKLTFSGVEFIELDGDYIGGSSIYLLDTKTIIVPTGQVWKIESAISSRYTSTYESYVSSNNVSINLNDISIAGFISSEANNFPFPIWLKSGTYELTLNYLANSSTTRLCKGFVSILIFNN